VDTYAIGKVRQALQSAKGSRTVAQKLLIDWAERDPRLLIGLTRNVLPAVVGSVLARVGGAAPGTPAPAPRAGPPRPVAPAPQATVATALNTVIDRNAPRFGLNDGSVTPPPAMTGEGHSNALRLLARMHARNRFG
jgi:hypothetical protein